MPSTKRHLSRTISLALRKVNSLQYGALEASHIICITNPDPNGKVVRSFNRQQFHSMTTWIWAQIKSSTAPSSHMASECSPWLHVLADVPCANLTMINCWAISACLFSILYGFFPSSLNSEWTKMHQRGGRITNEQINEMYKCCDRSRDTRHTQFAFPFRSPNWTNKKFTDFFLSRIKCLNSLKSWDAMWNASLSVACCAYLEKKEKRNSQLLKISFFEPNIQWGERRQGKKKTIWKEHIIFHWHMRSVCFSWN